MWKLWLAPTLLLAQGPEISLGAGPLTFSLGGKDVQLNVRLAGSRWLYGYKYVQFTDDFHDPYTGRLLTKTRETMTGPTITYLFRPDRGFSWMLGGSVMRWSKREESMYTGEVGRDATTAAFVGGGFYGVLGRHFYYQVGIYLAPGAKVNTRTSVSSEEDSGGIDGQLHLGMRF